MDFEKIISMYDGRNVTSFINKGLTQVFYTEKDAIDFVSWNKGYYYPALADGLKVYCVPK